MKRGENMSEVIKKFALPLVVLGFYPLAKMLGELTINVPTYGPDVDVSLGFIEILWAIAFAVSMLASYKEFKK